MALDISDGFNFAIGQWLGDLTIGLIGLVILIPMACLIYIGMKIYERISYRR